MIIVNYFISLLFTFSSFYFFIIAIQEIRILKHYAYDAEIKSEWRLLLLGAETICKIIIYFIMGILIVWIYFNYDLFLSISGGSLVDMV